MDDRRRSHAWTTVAQAVGWISGCAWLVGLLATDHWRVTQALWWVPWPVYAFFALPAAAFACRRSFRSAFLPCVPCLAIVGVGLWRDVGLRGADDHARSIRVVHWNASWPDARDVAEPARRILARDADIVVLSNPYRFFGDGRAAEWREQGYDVIVVGVFAIASRLPVFDARQVLGSPGVGAATFTIDSRAALGHTTSILAIDLPSAPGRGRGAVAADFVEHLAERPHSAPDIVVGDFNITRGSASLRVIAPELHHAWTDGGRGWGATWPRRFPLLHIDHILIAPNLCATRYELFDPGGGVHRAQEATIATSSD